MQSASDPREAVVNSTVVLLSKSQMVALHATLRLSQLIGAKLKL